VESCIAGGKKVFIRPEISEIKGFIMFLRRVIKKDRVDRVNSLAHSPSSIDFERQLAIPFLKKRG